MRQKTLKVIFTFSTTEHAMAVESAYKKQAFPGRIIPLPPEIASGCGLCWCCLPEERAEVEGALSIHSLFTEKIYEIMLY